MKVRMALFLLAAMVCVAGTDGSQSATTLVMGAHWDNKTYIQGTVTLAKVNANGSSAVVATKTLAQGWASVTEPLATNATYSVILRTTKGTELLKFPITTALINPANLKKAEIDLVVHASNNALATANFTVAMAF